MKPGIAVIGEYMADHETHTALNGALDYLKKEYEFTHEWIDTDRVEKEGDACLRHFSGIWSAPGSPFKSLEGVLCAIQYARLNNIPHLGTCAGFQHTIIEFARNVLGRSDAQHEEYDSGSSTLFINRLVCSLAGKTMEVFLEKDSMACQLYGSETTRENYYCNFGINPDFRKDLTHPLLLIAGVDQDNEIRIIETLDHPFFLITLFVPQTRSSPDFPHPLIKGFVEAVCSGV